MPALAADVQGHRLLAVGNDFLAESNENPDSVADAIGSVGAGAGTDGNGGNGGRSPARLSHGRAGRQTRDGQRNRRRK
ncbi:MAG: hypothetical protein F4W95_00465 [Chloroflexi bacterium]|nr:hypothetical protein [Chloroflexota bacterium]MYD46940.1 hypothetical protein [Chloroflexota bacterium]